MSRIHNHILWILCFCSFVANAQSFKSKAAIEPVSQTGFYAISITPELSSYLKSDCSDLRIVDEKENAVPYIVRSNLPFIKPASYKLFKIISNELADSGRSTIIIENPDKEKINDFFLKIKNASVSRTIDLSGSDDKSHWFSITENIYLEKKFVTDDDSYMENIDFPLSSYHYFRLTIYNGKNDPLNIISAGRYIGEEQKTISPIIENPLLKFSQKDSNHVSYITLFNPNLYHVGFVSMHLKAPKFFKRDVEMIASGETLGNFIISSDSVFQFNLPVFKDSLFEIRINNEDNPPLVVASVSTGQEPKKVIAYLEAGVHYILQLNNDSVAAPHYDLQSFADSISSNVPEVKLSNIENLLTPTAPVSNNFFKQAWVWPVIIFVLILLVLFTLRLSKEVEKKN